MRKLPKPRFNLKSPNAKRETLIFLVFRYNGKKLLYSTGLTIHPRDWDASSQRPFEKEWRKDLTMLYQQLENLNAKCKKIFIDSGYGNILITEFKERLDQSIAVVPQPKPSEDNTQGKITFLDFLDFEMAEMEATGMKKDTLKTFRLHVKILKKFANEYGEFDFEDVDWNLRLKLIDWLCVRDIRIGYGNKTLKVFRQFMERARRKKLHNNTDYQGSGWTVGEKKAIGCKAYLTTSELQFLSEMPLTGLKEKARDLFLIGAGTGQRFSDYSQYTSNDFYTSFQGIPLISVVSKKTNTPAKVPLNIFPWLIPVLEKYDYTSPTLSMQKLNDGIKKVCLEAGITEKILKIDQFFGRKVRVVKTYVPKYKLMASHACRRSFATNLYHMGFKISQIMPMTGHSTESQLREYIGIDKEQNAEEIGLIFQNQNFANRLGKIKQLRNGTY